MARANDYTVILNTKLDISQIQKDIAALQKQLNSSKINFNALDNTVVFKNTSAAMKETASSTKKLKNETDDLSLTYQVANQIFQTSIDVISAVVGQVFELDSAITELNKVTSLSSSRVKEYVNELTELGNAVARTGKPKCLSRNVRMVNVH